MAAPKKRAAKSKVDKTAPAKQKEQTEIQSVKVEEKKKDLLPLKRGDEFLFIKNGEPVYYTRSAARVLFMRNTASLVIPKGSEFVPPQGSKCDGC